VARAGAGAGAAEFVQDGGDEWCVDVGRVGDLVSHDPGCGGDPDRGGGEAREGQDAAGADEGGFVDVIGGAERPRAGSRHVGEPVAGGDGVGVR